MLDSATAGLRLASYARVSTEEQREGQTIDSQVAELDRFAREKAWLIVDVYKDEGWSGALMARPALDRLRDDARKGLFQAVLINDVDRLARDVAHLGIIKRDLERQGVKVIFRKLPAESSPTNNLMVNILGSFAEFERELIADRTRRGRRHKVEVRQEYLGSITAYGYRYIPKDRAAGKDGVLEVAPEEAAIVRQMFEWVAADALSARQIVHRLNDLKIPPRKGGRRWGKSSVLRILRNEMYAGVWYYNKYEGCEPQARSEIRYRKDSKSSMRQRPRSEWLPLVLPESLRIVPRDRWARVQKQLDLNVAFSPRNEKHPYLLKGLVQCGGCKSRYVGDPCHGKFYYRCHARCKRYPSIREEALNETVVQAIEQVIQNPSVILDQIRKLDQMESDQARAGLGEAEEVEYESNRVQTEEQRILDAYRTGIISPAQLGQQLEKLKTRRAALEARRATLLVQNPTPPTREQVTKSVKDYCQEAARQINSFTREAWRDFLRLVVRNIVFEGTQVRIEGQIPAAGNSRPADPDLQPEWPTGSLDGRIATTTAYLHGRNPGGENWHSDSISLNVIPGFPPFEIRQSIVRHRHEQPRDGLGRFCRRRSSIEQR